MSQAESMPDARQIDADFRSIQSPAALEQPQQADTGKADRVEKEVAAEAVVLGHLPPFAKCWSITSRIQTDRPMLRASAAVVHFTF